MRVYKKISKKKQKQYSEWLERPENIMEIDLSLNRSLEELVSSYFEAYEAGMGCDSFLAVNVNSTAADVSDYYVLENYLSDYGAI